MTAEKPKVDYRTGTPEKWHQALARRKAMESGRLPEFEALQKKEVSDVAPAPEKRDFVAGDAQRLAEQRERLKQLYPKTDGKTPDKKAA